MGKEVKIGLAVIGTLAIVFCGVLYQRINKLKSAPVVAKGDAKDSKGSAKSDLFSSPKKLTAVEGQGDDDQTPPATGSNWNNTSTTPRAEDAARTRASFLPTQDENAPGDAALPADEKPVEPTVGGDRYADRYAQERETAPRLIAQDGSANDVGSTLAENEASDVSANETTPSEASAEVAAPVASANPFARTAPPVEEAAPPARANPFARSAPAVEDSEPVVKANPFARSAPVAESAASEPPIADEPTADVAATEPPPREIAISEAAAPRFQDDAPPVASTPMRIAAPQQAITDDDEPLAPPSDEPAHSIADSTPSTQSDASYTRPAGRFVQSNDERPMESAAPRYGAATSRVVAPQQPAIAAGKYKLGPNENFWTVSERAYGSGGYFKALHAYNAEQHPVQDELTVGDEIMVPVRTELEREFPALCPKPGRRPAAGSFAMQASAKIKATGNMYVVQEGDTLFDIARYELGKASRWAELYEMNKDVIGDDIDFLRAGMEITLPDDTRKPDAITRQPGSSLR